jgi:hypothetical protein
VLTFDQQLLRTLPQARFVPIGGCWIPEADQRMHAKTANVSIIASAKRDMPGQRMRHAIVRKLGHRLDAVLGHGYRPIGVKTEGLQPYRYSIVVENCSRDFYFSEKLIDCLRTGTVPIYCGCPTLAPFLDPGGIITFDSTRSLARVLDRIGPDDYERRLPAIRRNFELAAAFRQPEWSVWRALRDIPALGAPMDA